MATRSTIAAKRRDGSYIGTYCHWDGYFQHNGALLLQYYNTQEKVEELLSFGAISSLDARCECPEGHTFDSRVKGYTVFYGRDRGESNQGPETGATASQAINKWGRQEYNYVWDGSKWLVDGAILTYEDCKLKDPNPPKTKEDERAEAILKVLTEQKFADFYTTTFEEYITGELEHNNKSTHQEASAYMIGEIKKLFKDVMK